MGESPIVFTKDEVEGLMRTDGTPLEAANTRKVELGDVTRNPDTQAPTAPPSLRKPGEKLPDDEVNGAMKPVQFPKPKPETQPGANPDDQPDSSQPAGGNSPGDSSQPGTNK